MSTRRILLLLPALAGDGGIQRFNRSLLLACEQSNTQTTVFSLNDLDVAVASLGVSALTRCSGFAGRRVIFAWAALRALAVERWDVVVIGHINLVRLVAVLLPIRRQRNVRTVLIAHGIEVWEGLCGTRALAICRLWRIACVSAYTRDRVLAQVERLSPTRACIFPNALSQSWLNRQCKHASSVTKRSLSTRYLLSVTRLAPTERYKGIVSAIEALSMVEDRSIHYIIAGRGEDAAFLMRVAERCGVVNRVHCIGGVSDTELTTLYRDALAFLLPSGKEGFGIVYLEAMHFGVPVVAARARGAVDVVRDGDTGLLVEYGDVAGIANAIDRLAANAPLRQRLIDGGRHLIEEGGEFTFEAMCRRWAALVD